jgi:hypothetical protein
VQVAAGIHFPAEQTSLPVQAGVHTPGLGGATHFPLTHVSPVAQSGSQAVVFAGVASGALGEVAGTHLPSTQVSVPLQLGVHAPAVVVSVGVASGALGEVVGTHLPSTQVSVPLQSGVHAPAAVVVVGVVGVASGALGVVLGTHLPPTQVSVPLQLGVQMSVAIVCIREKV